MLASIHHLISHVDILDDLFYLSLSLLLICIRTMVKSHKIKPKHLVELLNIQSIFYLFNNNHLKIDPQHRRKIKTDLKLPSFQ